MAQLKFRGNLSSKLFPFLSNMFGPSVVMGNSDQSNLFGDNGGDANVPQGYYMHNVMPMAQGFKSVGYRQIVPSANIKFKRVIPIRDPDMTRGWLAVNDTGSLFLYRAGDSSWTNVTAMTNGWKGKEVSVAYVNGYTYLCLQGVGIFRVNVAAKSVTYVPINGLTSSQIVAITGSANYMVLTDGLSIYWSSTISAEDFVPSLVTGAGSGKPTDLEGNIVALVPLGSGFAIYTSVNVVVASYSQNPKFPWVFKGVQNSKGIADVQHVTYGGEDGNNYAWTSAGIQKISLIGGSTYLPEVTDFLAGKEYEDWNPQTQEVETTYTDYPLQVKLAFVGARYLVISYGVTSLEYALVFDTALKRWGKLKHSHISCFDISLNSDNDFTTSNSASAKTTLGLLAPDGSVIVCDFDNAAVAEDSILVLGKFQLLRARLLTLDNVIFESIESNKEFDLTILTTLDGKTTALTTTPALVNKAPRLREYVSRVTGTNHSLVLKGSFNLSSFQLVSHINGRR